MSNYLLFLSQYSHSNTFSSNFCSIFRFLCSSSLPFILKECSRLFREVIRRIGLIFAFPIGLLSAMPPCWSADSLCRSEKQPRDTAFLYIFDTPALKSSHPFRHSEARLKPNAADDRRTFPYSHLLNLFLFLTCGKYTHFFPNSRSFCDGFRHHKDTAEYHSLPYGF